MTSSLFLSLSISLFLCEFTTGLLQTGCPSPSISRHRALIHQPRQSPRLFHSHSVRNDVGKITHGGRFSPPLSPDNVTSHPRFSLKIISTDKLTATALGNMYFALSSAVASRIFSIVITEYMMEKFLLEEDSFDPITLLLHFLCY